MFVLQVVRRLFTTHRLAFEKKATEYMCVVAQNKNVDGW